jgi:hypothetical protein
MWINRDADNHIVGINHGLTSVRIAFATGPRLKGRRHAQPMPTRLGVESQEMLDGSVSGDA